VCVCGCVSSKMLTEEYNLSIQKDYSLLGFGTISIIG
jgi:hypothetical protein